MYDYKCIHNSLLKLLCSCILTEESHLVQLLISLSIFMSIFKILVIMNSYIYM
jgi:hypothetical protein